MIDILWAIINYGLLAWIITLFVKAVKLLKAEKGKLSSVILSVGIILLFIGAMTSYNHVEDEKLKNHTDFLSDRIKFSPFNTLSVLIQIDEVNNESKFKTMLHSKVDFLIKPISWKYVMGVTNKTETGYSYQIVGVKEWNMLSIRIFSQDIDLTREIETE